MKKIAAILLSALLPAFAFSQAYGVFQPGGDLTGTWNSQQIATNAITLSKMATVVGTAGSTSTPALIGNNTSTATTPIALTPLQVNAMLGTSMAVSAICDSYCLNTIFGGGGSTGTTLPSGGATVDGVVMVQGQTVLITGYIINTYLNGIYIVNTSSTWTRSNNFVGTLPQNCDVAVFVRSGNVYGGDIFSLATTSGAITIGSTAQTWTLSNSVGALPGASTITLNPPTGSATVTVQAVSPNSSTGEVLNIQSGVGTESSGGTINITVPTSVTQGTTPHAGGGLNFAAGSGIGVGAANGGSLFLSAGNGAPSAAGVTGRGGNVTLTSGTAFEGNGGTMALTATNGASTLGTARNGGTVTITSGTAVNSGVPGSIALAGPVLNQGTQATPSGCSISASSGGVAVGQYTSGTSGTCTVTIALPTVANIHGYFCSAHDETTAADYAQIATATTSTLTVSGTTVSGDIVKYFCEGY
jgi:hypothetical protein